MHECTTGACHRRLRRRRGRARGGSESRPRTRRASRPSRPVRGRRAHQRSARAAPMPGDRRRPPDRSRLRFGSSHRRRRAPCSSRSTASRIDDGTSSSVTAEIIAWSSSGCPPLRSCRTPARSSPASSRVAARSSGPSDSTTSSATPAPPRRRVTTINKRRARWIAHPSHASVDDSVRWWRSSMTSTIGTRPGEYVEGPQHRPEQLTLAALGARRHRRRCCRMSDPDRRGQRRRLVGRQPVERTGLGHTHGRRDRVGDGCQWEVSAELVAATLGDEHPAAIEATQPRADERRLPDPGLALDGDDRRPPTVHVVEEPVEPRQLRAAARAGRAAATAGRSPRPAIRCRAGVACGAVRSRRSATRRARRRTAFWPCVRGERGRRAPRRCMRPHEHPEHVLVVRMLDEHGLRLGDDGCPVTGRERRLDLDPAGRRDPPSRNVGGPRPPTRHPRRGAADRGPVPARHRQRHGRPRAGRRTVRRTPPRPGDRSRRCRARLPSSAYPPDRWIRWSAPSTPRSRDTSTPTCSAGFAGSSSPHSTSAARSTGTTSPRATASNLSSVRALRLPRSRSAIPSTESPPMSLIRSSVFTALRHPAGAFSS